MAIADVIADVRRLVQDEPWADQLSAAYTAAGATVSVDNPVEWEQGDVMDFPGVATNGSYEQMQVTEDDITANPIDVRIGWNDTTNQNHADNAVVLKNPRYGTDQVAKAIDHTVETRLWPDLWVVSTTTITPSTSTNIYDLPADYEDFVQLVQLRSGAVEDLVHIQAKELWHVPTAISATNKALRVVHWPRLTVDATLFYRTQVTTTNMTSEMEPIIALGTAAHLVRLESLEKSDRADEDDRPGRFLRTSRELERMFDEEKQKLRAQLMRQWGQVRRWRSTGVHV